MGTWIGHIVPGSFFILFGAWWIFRASKGFLQSFSKRGGQRGFQCQVTYPPALKCCNLDLEALLAISAAAMGMVIELWFACSLRNMPIGVSNMQHATMYFFFGLCGFLGVLAPTLGSILPNLEDIRYLALAMAFTAEGCLFKFHLLGRDHLNTTLHILLLYSIYGCIIMTLLELVYRDQVLMSVGRGFFTVLQGTWFWQIAFILYNPIPGHTEWDHSDSEHGHHQVMLTTCYYTWHVGAIFLFTLGCALGWACVLKKNGDLDEISFTLEPVSNGYTHLISKMDVENAEDEEEMQT